MSDLVLAGACDLVFIRTPACLNSFVIHWCFRNMHERNTEYSSNPCVYIGSHIPFPLVNPGKSACFSLSLD